MTIDQSIRDGLLHLEGLLKNCRINEGYLVLTHGKYKAVAELSDLESKSNCIYWRFSIDQVRQSQVCINTVKRSLCCFDPQSWG